MSETFTGNQLKAIPIESLVASPLVAVVRCTKTIKCFYVQFY